MKVHISDDRFDALRTLPGFDRLKGHDATIWTDHTEDEPDLQFADISDRINACASAAPIHMITPEARGRP